MAVPALSGQVLDGRVQVVDGDTLRIGGETVRLHAIDAPEIGQSCANAAGRPWACGQAAAAALGRLAAEGLRCEGRERDRYGRLVAKCYAAGRDVGAELVRQGAAFAYARFGDDYVALEKEALFAGRGVWQGAADRPEEARREALAVTQPQTAEGGNGCRIKGNISGSGRIYHMPGQEHYAVTRINPARGERWFCTEAEARAAGWRRARR